MRARGDEVHSITNTAKDLTQSLGDAALAYAARGWLVFPVHGIRDGVCTCGKPECSSPGKHPRTRKGFKDATTSAAKIQTWWNNWPDSNIGIATGKESGLLVLDVDPGGEDSLYELSEGEIPQTAQQETGRGTHYLFKYPDFEIRGSVRKWPGLDIRAEGGYIIAAPSLHLSGARYEWAQSPDALSPAPDWLLETLKPTKKTEEAQPEIITKGQRNDFLFRKGCSMRTQGACKANIAATLQRLNREQCSPPLDDAEIDKIVASARKYRPGMDSAKHRYLDWLKTPLCPADGTTAAILRVTIDHADKGGRNCYPPIELIAQESHFSVRTVKQCLSRATQAGWINRRWHKAPGQQHANYIYSIPSQILKQTGMPIGDPDQVHEVHRGGAPNAP